MFLDWIANLGYLNHEKESGILLSFPISTRNTISFLVADHLLKDSTPTTTLSTIAHVNLVMECVGQGFGLPTSEGNTIKAGIELYRRWLLEKVRPQPVEVDEQRIFRLIFRHFSLLFSPRTEKETSIDLQAELCITILGVLENAGKIKDHFSKETWEELLYIMLGIVDSLLKGGRGGVDQVTPLGSKLCPHLLKALFELFLRSGTQNNELWNQLKELVQGWRHRMPLIIQWNATCLGLTNRVIRLSYGNEEGSDFVTIIVNNTTTNIELTEDHTYYCWYRMLYVIGDLETLTLPPNYLEAFQGIRAIVNSFLAIKEKPGSPAPPNGNTILNIVGAWLFKAVNIKKKDSFDHGIAEAITTLCSIFIKKSKTAFLDEYFACFYRGLEESIQKNPFLMDVVIRNSKTLFQCELKGSRKLIPFFLKAIKSILSQPKGKQLQGTASPVNTLRGDCISILAYMISLTNTFQNLKFFGLTKEGLINSYSEINLVLDGEILLEALRTEEATSNINMLFRVTTCYIYENITIDSPFPNLFATLLLHQIMAPEAWNSEVILNALNVLGELANLYPLFKKEKNKEISFFLVTTLCKYIDIEQSSTSKPTPSEDLIAASYYCILKWIMADQWILKDKDVLIKLFEAIGMGLSKKSETSSQLAKSNYHATEKITEAANYVLNNILNRLDCFPGVLGPQVVSCPKNEAYFLETLQLKPKNFSSFVFDQTLITVIKHSTRDTKLPTCTLIVRDVTGKYIWTTQIHYSPVPEIEIEPYSGTSKHVISNPFEEQKIELSESEKKFYTSVIDLFDASEKRRFEIIVEKISEREKQERQHLEKTNFGLNVDIHVPKFSNPPIDESNKSLSSSRLFLTHFAFSSLNNYGRFLPVQPLNAVQPFNFLENFKQLDQTIEREYYYVAVLFVGTGQNKEEEILRNRSGSPEYQYFVENVGWMTDISQHLGYKGGLDIKHTGMKGPYYSTFDYELVFHVSTLMPNIDQLTQKKSLLQGVRVLITWVEEYDKYDRQFLKLDNIAVNIVIIPLKSRMYRIKIFSTTPQIFGPLLDEMVVSQKILPILVRETAVNAIVALREDKRKQFIKRREMIDGFCRNHRVQDSVSNFYAAQFI